MDLEEIKSGMFKGTDVYEVVQLGLDPNVRY